jgi:hypothetical protein
MPLAHILIQNDQSTFSQPIRLKTNFDTILPTPYRPSISHFLLEWQVKVKVEVKFTLEQVTKAQSSSRGTALLFPQPQH